MMEDMKDPEFQRVLNETLTQLTASTATGAPVTAPAADSATLSATAAATLFSTLSAGDGVSSSDSLMKTLEVCVSMVLGMPGAGLQCHRAICRCSNG
jgi:hypothetical protein